MITFYAEVSPRQYVDYQANASTKIQPSWYRGERYDYVEQISDAKRKKERRSFLRRSR